MLTGNDIGVGANGLTLLGNQGAGIDINAGANNRIGTDGSGIDDAADRNIIGANSVAGIDISNSGSNNNVVAGNYIGVGSDGATPVGNGLYGVAIDGGQFNRIGVLTNNPDEGNVIANTSGDGVFLGDPGTDNNIIAGNIIGLAADGVTAAPNTGEGILIYAGPSYNRIGTYDNAAANAAQRNIISGNTGSGIELYTTGTATVGNTIAGNYIGTDENGTSAVPNRQGGVFVRAGVTSTVIGTAGGVTNSLARNVISGNNGFGVDIDPTFGTAGMYTLLSGNFIGTTPDGLTALPNAGDGVVINNSNNNVIGVPGAGSFRPHGDFSTDTGPQSVAVGDFNGDGIPDLVTANTYSGYYGSTVSVLLGNGDGSFGTETSYSVGTNPFTGNNVVPDAVAIGDLNGDGKPDIITANTDGSVSVLLGNGDGTFQAAQVVPVGLDLTGIAVGDFTGVSGEVDVAVSDHLQGVGGGFALLRNFTPASGGNNASFAHVDSVTSADGYDAITMGDFNGDGKADIAAVSTVDSKVTVVLGNTADSLAGNDFSTSNLTSGDTHPTGITVGDFRGNGTIDLATTDDIFRFSVLQGQGDGTFNSAVVYYYNTSIGYNSTTLFHGITAGDFSGDGKDDLAIATSSAITGDPSLTIIPNQGDGTFGVTTRAFTYGTSANGYSPVAADFNGDGTTDLAVVNPSISTVSIYLGNRVSSYEGNVISGNQLNGVDIAGSSSSNTVAGNLIGPNVNGQQILNGSNGADGVALDNGTSDNRIGVSGDGIDPTLERNVISGNTGPGVVISLSTNNTVAGNYIGTDSTGQTPLANPQGVLLQAGASDNLIGVNPTDFGAETEGNVIAGNTDNNIFLGDGTTTTGNVIAGNFVGTNMDGQLAIGNSLNGPNIELSEVSGNTIGGTSSLERNVISGGSEAGVEIDGNGTVLLPGTESMYPLTSDVNDSVGSNNGTFISASQNNTPSFATSDGLTGLQLNGTDAYVSVGNVFDAGFNSFSIEGWVELASLPATSAAIVAKGLGNGGPGYGLFRTSSTGEISFTVSDGTVTDTTAGGSIPLLADGKFHHIAGVYDSVNDTIAVYLDGQFDGELFTNGMLGSPDNTLDFTIGAAEDTNGAPDPVLQRSHQRFDRAAV